MNTKQKIFVLTFVTVFLMVAAIAIPAEAVMPTNTWAYYECDNDVTDTTGNFSLSNSGISFDTGVIGDACVMGDATDGATATPAHTSEIKTIDFWYKATESSVPSHRNVFIFSADDGGENVLYVRQKSASDRMGFLMFVGNVLKINIETTISMETDTWHHIILTNDGGWKIYLDGDTTPDVDDADTTNLGDWDTVYGFGQNYNGQGTATGMVDNLYISKDSFSTTNVTYSYNGGAGRSWDGGTPTPFFSWTSPPTPTDAQLNNTYIGVTIEGECTESGGVNLWWNGSLAVFNTTSSGSFTLNSSLVPDDGTYSYWGSCTGESNSTARTWELDTYTPIISLNSNNGFNALNVTTDPTSDTLLLNISVQEDRDLFAFEVNISNSSGSTYLYTNSSLSGTTFDFITSIDVSEWAPSEYNVNILAADSHTKKEIDKYKIIKSKSKLQFETDEKIKIGIESLDESTADSSKKKDRYDFNFNFKDKGNKDRIFTVTSDYPIKYLETSKYVGHFVTWNGKEGNWIDFEGAGTKPTVVKISDYEYRVKFKNLKDDITFNSVGGLNIRDVNYIYSRSTLSVDSVSIQPSSPIFTDDLRGLARGVEGLGNPGFFEWAFYGNMTYFSSGSTGNYSSGAVHNIANITANYTSYGSNWTFSARFNSMGEWSPWVNSSTVRISLQALNVTIRDETTGSLITENVTVVVTGQSSETRVFTSSGFLLISDLQNGENSFSFSSESYSQRTYIVTLSNLSQSLTAYLGANTSSTTFTVKDIVTGETLESVTSGMYRLIGGSWTPVETRYSDVTGRVIFNYIPENYYRFVMTKAGYGNLVFFLNPVVYPSYDIYLTPTETQDSTQDFDLVSIMWEPELVFDAIPINFTFLVQSPVGILLDYGYYLTYPGGNANSSGSNAIGSELRSEITTAGATSFDRVQVDYYYVNSIDGLKEFTAYIPISANISAMTLVSQKDNHYGMGFLERLFWITIILLIVVGVPSSIGKPFVGGILGMFTIGVLIQTGFMELWLGLIPIFLGLIYLSSQGGA